MPLFLAAVVAAATAAAPVPAAAPVDPAALAAARGIVQQLDVRGQLLRGMNQSVAAMRSGVAMRSMLAGQPGFIAAYNANTAKFDAALKNAGAIQAELAEKIIRENAGAVADAAARAYARNYSAAELKALGDFYKTPLGVALNQRQPRVIAEIGQAQGALIGGKMQQAMQANAKRIEAALAPLNSAPPPAAPPKK